MEKEITRIAVITEDGERVSSHFGTAQYYEVFHVVGSEIIKVERREKPYNTDPKHVHSRRDDGARRHGRGVSSAYDKYRPIQDCQILIAGGVGENAYQHLQEFGFQVILKGGKIKDAVEAYLKGNLESDLRRLHK